MKHVYATRAAIVVDGWYPQQILGADTVFERSAEPVDTGLVDPYGNRILRRVVPEPMGFRLSRETE